MMATIRNPFLSRGLALRVLETLEPPLIINWLLKDFDAAIFGFPQVAVEITLIIYQLLNLDHILKSRDFLFRKR